MKIPFYKLRKFFSKSTYYQTYTECIYSGKGYLQGIGFSVETRVTEILGFKFINSVSISTDGEWLEKLKVRLNLK